MMQELNYIRCGDYYIPHIKLPEETRPIGRFGRMYREYLKVTDQMAWVGATNSIRNRAEEVLISELIYN